MVIASDLRAGIVIRIEGQVHRVLEVEAKAGAAKMGGIVRAKLINVNSHRLWELHFRPQERLEEAHLERRIMEFLFADGDNCTFMRPDTFEQIEIPASVLGAAKEFLQSGMEIPIEFCEGEAVGALIPDAAEVRVTRTASPSHSQHDSGAWKEAILENGLTVKVHCSSLLERQYGLTCARTVIWNADVSNASAAHDSPTKEMINAGNACHSDGTSIRRKHYYWAVALH